MMEQVGQRKIDGLWLAVVGIAVLFFLILPTLIVIPMSFSGASYLEFPPTSFSLRWYAAYFGSAEWMSATKTSLIAAFLTTAIATPLGSLCAYGLHCSTPRIRTSAQFLVIMPIVVPVILIGVGVFSLYAKLGLNYTLTGSWLQSTLNRGQLATRGASQSLSLEVAVPLSDLEFYKLNYRGEIYFPLFGEFTLHLRGEVG